MQYKAEYYREFDNNHDHTDGFDNNPYDSNDVDVERDPTYGQSVRSDSCSIVDNENVVASPRDDRFYTPRNTARSNSSSDGFLSPRFDTPRTYSSMSDNEFQTPRQYIDGDRKATNIYAAYGAKNTQNRHFENLHQRQNQNQNQNQNQKSKFTIADEKSEYLEEEDDEYLEDEIDHYEVTSDPHLGVSEKDIEDIFSFARHGRLNEIERLLSKGIPVDIKDFYGNTLLTIASQNGNKRVAKSVLRRGANINSRNLKGNTPLHYCCHYGYEDSLGQYLISKGADNQARNNLGKLPHEGI